MAKTVIEPLDEKIIKSGKSQREYAKSKNLWDATIGYWRKKGWHIDKDGGLWSYKGNINDNVKGAE